MGYYIETGSPMDKAQWIVDNMQGQRIEQPRSFDSVPADKALVCVIDNGFFEAAGYCYDGREFFAFTDESDNRPKEWLLVDLEPVQKATGYTA